MVRETPHYIISQDKKFIGVIKYQTFNSFVTRVISFGKIENNVIIPDCTFENKNSVLTRLKTLKNAAPYIEISIAEKNVTVDIFHHIMSSVDFESEQNGSKIILDVIFDDEKQEIIHINSYVLYHDDEIKTYTIEGQNTDVSVEVLRVFVSPILETMFPPVTICDPLEKILYIEVGENGYIGSYIGRKIQNALQVFNLWPELQVEISGNIRKGSFKGSFHSPVLAKMEPGLYKLYRLLDEPIQAFKICDKELIEKVSVEDVDVIIRS